jgi:hypothetical protein
VTLPVIFCTTSEAGLHVFIIALAHNIQYPITQNDSDNLRDTKIRYLSLVTQIVNKNQVQRVFEESAQGRETIAAIVASRNVPSIKWVNIDMTTEQRLAAGIYQALKRRPGGPDLPANPGVWIDYRIPEDDVREKYFIDRITSECQTCQSALLVVGDMHAEAIAETLRGLGHTADCNRELIRTKQWQ